MSIQDVSRKDLLRRGFRHPANQRGWTNVSPRPSRTLEEASYLGDEEYHDRLGVHTPLWRYIINRYTKESDTPLMAMSYQALPIAIELSQWTYPVVYVAETDKEVADVKRDAARQAGFFKQLIKVDYKSYRGGYPYSRVAIFVGVIDEMDSSDARDFIDNLLESAQEIVCAVTPNRDWRDVLAKYKVNGLNYYRNKWSLLRISK